MSRAFLALLLLLAGTQRALADDALSAIDDCVAKLGGTEAGYKLVAERCPNLAATLKSSEYAPWLPRDWDRPESQVSWRGLQDLRLLLTREVRREGPGAALSVSDVPALIAQLAAADQPQTLWQRFIAWLERLLTPRADPQRPSWLQRFLEGLSAPDRFWRSVTWVSLALVVALAMAVAINELRVAGVLRGPRRVARPAVQRAAAGALTLADVAQAEPSQQPRLLLELVAARLNQQARLPPPRALTVRELASAAQLTDPADRERISDLAGACEWQRYCERPVAPAVLEHALRAGRELLASLDAAATQPAAT